MGLFDYVNVDSDYRCSEGHDLSEEDFQTKDLGCTMGNASLIGGRLEFEDGGYGTPIRRPFLGCIQIYCECTRCPAFLQAGTANLIGCWVEFEVEIVDDVVRKVTQISPDTAEWLRTEPTKPYMHGAVGPLSYNGAIEVARKMRSER